MKKNIIKTSKIINLIQTKPQIFQLKNQNTLIFNETMNSDFSRIEKVGKLLNSLV